MGNTVSDEVRFDRWMKQKNLEKSIKTEFEKCVTEKDIKNVSELLDLFNDVITDDDNYIDYIHDNITDSELSTLLFSERMYSYSDELPNLLKRAAIADNYKLVCNILFEGIDPDVKFDNGKTLYITACEMGYLDIVKLLLENYTIDVSLTDNDGKTGEDYVKQKNHSHISEYLNEED